MARLRAIEELDCRRRLFQDSLVQFRLSRRRIIAAGKAAVVIYLIATPSLHPCRTSKTLARKQSKPALYGLYSIDRYTRDGRELALNGSHRWTQPPRSACRRITSSSGKARRRPAEIALYRLPELTVSVGWPGWRTLDNALVRLRAPETDLDPPKLVGLPALGSNCVRKSLDGSQQAASSLRPPTWTCSPSRRGAA